MDKMIEEAYLQYPGNAQSGRIKWWRSLSKCKHETHDHVRAAAKYARQVGCCPVENPGEFMKYDTASPYFPYEYTFENV
jgi:hypothetical protein